MVVLFDANTKPSKEYLKHCAEQYLMDRTGEGQEKVDQVLAFVVVARPQPDDDSKVNQVTLTPCKPCRDRMLKIAQEEQSRISLDTEVVTAHAGQTAFQKIQRVKDLHKFHGEEGYLEID